jgi:cell division protein FtsN
MARDYKQRRRARKQPTPGWIWFLSGLTLGLAVALFIHLRHATTAPPAEPVATRAVKPASQQAEESAELEQPAESGFDFYTMLPGLEVVVPEEETRASAGGAGSSTPAPQLAPGRYWIQAGSFRRYQDADRRKAELALLGLASGIQAVNLDGQTWHRVRIGPLSDAAQAEATRRRLAESGIGALAVRERD